MILFLALIISISYVFIAYKIVSFGSQFIRRNRVRVVSKYLVLLIVCIAPFSEAILSNLTLKYFCLAHAGEEYFAAPKTRSGLFYSFDESLTSSFKYSGCSRWCLEFLFRGEYPFVEYFVNNNEDGLLPVGGGFTQFYLEEKGHENCRLFEASIRDKTFKFSSRFLGTNKCLAVTKSKNQTASIYIRESIDTSLIFGNKLKVVKQQLIEIPKQILASYTWVTVRSATDSWFLPFLHKNSCGVDVNYLEKLKPTTHWSRSKS